MISDRQRLKKELSEAGARFEIKNGVRGQFGGMRFERGWYTVSLQPAITPARGSPRRLIICIDGTWNEPESHTNVARLAQALDTGKQSGQVVRYYSGVGVRLNQGPSFEMRHNWQLALESAAKYWTFLPAAFRRWLRHRADSKTPSLSKTLLGGGLGLGIDRIRRRAFFDLAAVYRPGDDIYIFGFSRGAAIARLLALQIAEVGIPKRIEATFRKSALADDIIDRDLVLEQTNLPVPNIKMLGVWDTVSSYIIPGEHDIELFKRDLTVAVNVETAYHLVAIDERRKAFAPSLMKHEDRVQEIWFPGVHTNVGGGYVDPKTIEPDFGISDISLGFMINRAKEHNVSFAHPSPLDPPLHPNARGPIDPSAWKLGKEDRLIHVEGKADARPLIHKSVQDRRDAMPYEPRPLLNLGQTYEVDERN